MPRPLTDIKILTAIYNRYYAQYAAYEESTKQRSAKVWVPIDIDDMADRLAMEPDILFGRLYYHLNNRYGFEDMQRQAEGRTLRVNLFEMRVGGDEHCIHFPMLASILATLQDENKKFRLATTLSVIALGLSLLAFFWEIFFKQS